MDYREITIEEFIKDFKSFGTSNEIVECFTKGYCYWFAFILKNRFPKGEIYYNAMNHFVLKYNNRLYDITGDCTDNWDNEFLMHWDSFVDIEKGSSYLNSLFQNTILKNKEI